MTRPYHLSAEGLEKKRIVIRKLHANPAFAARHRERMKALHADSAYNPLAGMSCGQRIIYRKLVREGIPVAQAIAEAKK